MSPASLGGGFHIVISRRYNLLLITALQSNALATLNDGASPLLNKNIQRSNKRDIFYL